MLKNTFKNKVYLSNNINKVGLFSAIKDIFKHEDLSQLNKDQFNFEEEKYPTDTFDYIIVGGGTAGAVTAWRLLDEGNNHVAVFESGSLRPHILSQIPISYQRAMENKKCALKYYTIPQTNLNEREILITQGKGFGGSSNIDNSTFVRATFNDFENWKKLGVKGWSYEECLPFFKKSETCNYGAESYRGKDGPIILSRYLDGFCSGLSDAFLKSGLEAGYKMCNDFNSKNNEGFGYYDMAIEDGKRNSTANAYIPFDYLLDYWGSQLFMKTMHKVDRLILEGDKVIGIESKGRKFLAKKEIILCCGTIETPVLLMRSGIGEENQLKKNGINVNINIPGIGENLQDHLEISLKCKTNEQSLYEIDRSIFTSLIGFYYWYLEGAGPFNSTHIDTGAFIKSDKNLNFPNIQMMFYPYLTSKFELGHSKSMFNGFQINAITLQPKSRGSITLENGGNTVFINPNYLSHTQDIEDMKKCVQICENLLKQKSLKNITTQNLSSKTIPLHDFIKKNANSASHLCGSCKMGDIDKDKYAVVDNQLCVRDIQNLRIIGSSAIPNIVSSNLNATIVMMAEKVCSSILQKHSIIKESKYIQRRDGVRINEYQRSKPTFEES